jgi:2-phosphosulfolactate phosphatase
VEGQTLVYCTTNGTRALEVARKRAPVAIGAFSNITALKEWLVRQQLPVVILCSGWKNKFCLEDTLFAGALAEMLLAEPGYQTRCDAAKAAMDLFGIARADLAGYADKAMHRERLRLLGLDDVVPYSFEFDHTSVVPVFNGSEIINMNK